MELTSSTTVREGGSLATSGQMTSTEVCHRSGVSYRQLDYWRRSGVLSWYDTDVLCSGSGSRTTWDENDARVFAVLAAYRLTVGMSAMDDLTGLARVAHDHETGFAVRVGETWEWRAGSVVDARDGQCLVVVPLSQ